MKLNSIALVFAVKNLADIVHKDDNHDADSSEVQQVVRAIIPALEGMGMELDGSTKAILDSNELADAAAKIL